MGAIEPREQDEWIKLLTDDQLNAIVSADPSGIDVRELSDEELQRIVEGDMSPR
jgi:hypothetical protein